MSTTETVTEIPLQSISVDGTSKRPTTYRSQSFHGSELETAPTTISTGITKPGHETVDIPRLPATLNPDLVKRQNRKGWEQFIAICYSFFVLGWNDGTSGPLLPVFQRDYHVGFAMVSLLFVLSCVGYLSGGFLQNIWLNDKLTFGTLMFTGATLQLFAYVIQAPAPPFAWMVFANYIAGFALSFQNAHGNGFVGSLERRKSTKLGILHASYGFGAFASPLASTHFSNTSRWSLHYAVSASFAVLNMIILAAVLRFKSQEELFSEAGEEHGSVDENNSNKYRQMMGLKVVHILTVFSLVYIGCEVTLGGWMVSYVIHVREGGSQSGYISSGFFGGLTLGRVALIWLNKAIGEWRVMFVYGALAIALEITVWFVPSIIENALAVSFIGLFLGPMFPLLVSHASHILPRWLLTGSLGWITGIGMAGAAALPLLTGLLAARFGISALQPLMVSMMSLMVGLWAFVPQRNRID